MSKLGMTPVAGANVSDCDPAAVAGLERPIVPFWSIETIVVPAGMPLAVTGRPAPSVAGEPIDRIVDWPFVSVPVWIEVKVSSFAPPAVAAVESVIVMP